MSHARNKRSKGAAAVVAQAAAVSQYMGADVATVEARAHAAAGGSCGGSGSRPPVVADAGGPPGDLKVAEFLMGLLHNMAGSIVVTKPAGKTSWRVAVHPETGPRIDSGYQPSLRDAVRVISQYRPR